MAVYESPVSHDHYVERQTEGTGSAFWAILAVALVVLLLILFGSNLFGRGNSNNSTGGTNIEGSGSVNTPSGGGSGSGSLNVQ